MGNCKPHRGLTKRSTKLFMDETRAPVLDPGSRKTKTGYFWALARDDRPWDGGAPPGGAFIYAPGRGGQHAERILRGLLRHPTDGWLCRIQQADRT